MKRSEEGFMTPADYPDVYTGNQLNEWHKYWHESKDVRVPFVNSHFDEYHKRRQGAESCKGCYYAIKYPLE